MKKYVMFSVVSLFALCSALDAKRNDRKYDALLTAVEQSYDEASVKKLLRRAGSLNEAQKNELLEAADSAVEECTQSISLLRSKRDLAKFVGGLRFVAIGLFSGTVIAPTLNDYDQEFQKTAVQAVGAFSTFLGFYGMLKGLKCSSARSRLENAENVEDLLNKNSVVAVKK